MAEGAPATEDRTEAATPRRLQRAREAGQVPVSRELPGFMELGVFALVLALAAPAEAHALALRLSILFRRFDLPPAVALQLAVFAALRAIAPVTAAALLAGAAAVLVQTGFLLSLTPLKPDPSRLSPAAGVRRLLGVESAVEGVKALAKLAAMSAAVWYAVRAALPELRLAPFRDPRALPATASGLLLRVLLAVLAVQAVIAVADLAWTRLHHARGLRMSREELREEQKESDGDPRIKARIRRIRLQRARRRMLAAVPQATVVVTNPTHYAVALAYDRGKTDAPRVVAKGVEFDGGPDPGDSDGAWGAAGGEPAARARAAPAGPRRRDPTRTLQGGGRAHRLCLAARRPRRGGAAGARMSSAPQLPPQTPLPDGPVPPVAGDAAERLRAIGAQTAGVAHDVNNLLTGIDAAAALALDRPGLDPETRADLTEIRLAVARGAALVQTLLATGARPSRPPRPCPLDPELAAAAVVIHRLLPPSVRFVQLLRAAGCRVRIDPDQLHHALLNLALNARDAMPAGGTLSLRSAELVLRRPLPTLPPPTPAELVPPGRYVVVSLRDTGPGIAPEVAAQLFTPFFSTRRGGSGLGLSQVRQSLSVAGGYLALGGRPGHGAVARLFLPLADPPPRQDPASVWLVEDEPVLRRLIQQGLHGAGWRVSAVGSAEAALAEIGPATPPPAVLLCDLSLPGMDGLALLRVLRRRWPALPAVLMSGHDNVRLPQAAAFLHKPFALTELAALVARLAGEPSADLLEQALGTVDS